MSNDKDKVKKQADELWCKQINLGEAYEAKMLAAQNHPNPEVRAKWFNEASAIKMEQIRVREQASKLYDSVSQEPPPEPGTPTPAELTFKKTLP